MQPKTKNKEATMTLKRNYSSGEWGYEYRPWHSDHAGEIPAFEVFAGEKVCDTNETMPRAEQEANARLIAVAPELVDALEVQTAAAQRVVDCWSEGDLAGAVRSLDCCLDASRGVLARATEG
jgi:hypothetical protein